MGLVLEDASRNLEKYPLVKPLFKSAFPPEERPPFFLLKHRAASGKGRMLVAKDNGEFIGFAYLIPYRDMAYLFFFAVDTDKRGKRYGTKILSALKELYSGKRLFLARETLDKRADNYEQRVKRHDFYLKNGFTDWPCQIKEGRVVYDVMGIGGGVSAGEYDALITRWAGKLVRRLIDMRIIEP